MNPIGIYLKCKYYVYILILKCINNLVSLPYA